MKIGLPLGISTTFWFFMGLFRSISESLGIPKPLPTKAIYSPRDIAVIVPAHNEELVIQDCIRALKNSFLPKQIHVISDGSTDKTYAIVNKEGCNVVATMPGLGKARALLHLINTYNLYDNYEFIMIVDADTKIDKNYITRALPYFNDPDISAVFPTARIKWPKHIIPRLPLYFVAYRERLDRALQFFVGYGQTWKYTNANMVTPGFATIYRSVILRQLRIDRPGILIEDFNLAFELHRKKLGAATFHPTFIGWDQHPDNLKDYWHQVQRWNIGFFQTYRSHGFWPSFFWLSTTIFSLEVFITSAVILVLPFIILFKFIPIPFESIPVLNSASQIFAFLIPLSEFTLFEIFLTMFWIDYMITIVIGIMGRKPQFIFYGLFFFFMHYVTALILMSAIIPGFFKTSNGKWVSPKRHTLTS